MNPVKWIAVAGGVVAGGFVAAQVARRRVGSPPELEASRWRAVTILKSRDEVMPGGVLPEPLLRLGDLVEVRVTDAPGDRGVELAARLRSEPESANPADRARGEDPRQLVRQALRESKQLIEVGEIIRVDPKPEGHRKPTPAGALVDLLSRRSAGEGVL